MPRPHAPRRRTGRPPLTSRPEIVAAARRLIDREGWEKLTVRRLAAELGIGATTLYHHIRDKDDLAVLLLNDYVARRERPALPEEPGERVIAAATALHDALAAWPWAAEVVTVDGFVGLLDEPALWMVEAIVAAAHDHGCTRDEAVDVFRGIWYYTVGEILVRARTARGQGEPDRSAHRAPAFGRFDPSQVPHLAAIGDRWPLLAARDTYPEGLRALTEGLLAGKGR
ncbi:TetR/AcrR family transcriptional regulator [Streptomyces sp. NPDC050560]|uniref:TetR/AcrR family transcriptional regulator n=1 Tax=Streptomyces sp. NPDC050560 TaxID=3365630 RepID=UPI0037A25FC8